MIKDKEKIINKTKEIIEDNKLLYLSLFGSHLYGTNNLNSDVDIRGIYLPTKKALYLDNIKHEINFSTGIEHCKNNSNDIDIKLFSIQKFLKLSKLGDTNALDLFFSYTYPETILYEDKLIYEFLYNVDKILDIKDMKAYYSYCIRQAQKYGIKGSRLGVIRQIKDW